MKKRTATIYNEDYQGLISHLVALRKAKGITQHELAKRTGFLQHDISKVENCVRRLDVLELHDWLHALGVKQELISLIKSIK